MVNKEIIIGLVCMIVGCLMLIFRDLYARSAIRFQNQFWGFHFGERDIMISKIVTIIVGVGFIIVGILAVSQMIRFR